MSYRTEETILYVKDVNVGYKAKDGTTKMILKDVNIVEHNIERDGVEATGQTIAFIGRSGRGKSTLFKALTGLLIPNSGTIQISEFETEDKDDAKFVTEGDIGFVDQKYTLFRHKTIYQICQYALRKSKLTKVEKEGLIGSYLIEWGLMPHKDKFPCDLSGGQRQRTAIIEQMLTSKRFMILDEPFSGLDVGNIEKVKVSFDKILNANEYNTIIFSTHDIRLAVELADSIYIIGHPEPESDYSTVVKHYDLKALGLAWQGFTPNHEALVDDIKQTLLNS